MTLALLAKRIHKGDRSAYREVIARYGKMVYYTALSELEDGDKALDASKQVFRSLFSMLRKGEVPDDPTKFLQRSVRYQCKTLVSEESVMSDLLADIQADSDVEMIFGDFAGFPDALENKPGQSEAASAVTNVCPPVQVTFAPGYAATQEIPTSPAAVIAAQVPDIASETVSEGKASQEASGERLTDEFAAKDSELYQQFYGQTMRKQRGSVGFFFGVLCTIILALLLIWIVCGLLGRFGVIGNLPDLGYSWFDTNIVPLF